MGKKIITQVQETGKVPNRINPRQNIPRHILIKLTKFKHKEQILKAAREKQQITHKGIPIRITADLSIETLQARREWQDILKMMKDTTCHCFVKNSLNDIPDLQFISFSFLSHTLNWDIGIS